MKYALITGISGQDGSYLAEFLLEKGYKVYGVIRRSSSLNTKRIEHIKRQLVLVYGDVTDKACVVNTLQKLKDISTDDDVIEIYNLAAQSHVKISFEMPEYTGQVDAMGVLNVLEAVRCLGIVNRCRFYQASTSEMFGKVQAVPQDENTPFYPRSPYGVAKLYAFWIIKNYREAYGMYACNGILFNHESPRRSINFVTRKVTYGIRKILRGEDTCLRMGNIYSKRDWGFAGDYVKAMWLMLQQDKADDFVISTNETHTVKEFIEEAFKEVGMDILWEGEGVDEIGYVLEKEGEGEGDKQRKRVLVKIDKKYFRPTEVELLIGDSSKARKELGWENECDFQTLTKMMVRNDVDNEDIIM